MLHRINLVPSKPFSEKLQAASTPILGGVLIIVLAIVYVIDHRLSKQIALLDGEISRIESQISMASLPGAQIGKLNDIIRAQKEEQYRLTADINKILAIAGKEKQYYRLLTFIAATMPATILFEQLSLTGAKGKISGQSDNYDDLPIFLEKLKASSLITNAVLLDVKNSPTADKGQLQFNMIFTMD